MLERIEPHNKPFVGRFTRSQDPRIDPFGGMSVTNISVDADMRSILGVSLPSEPELNLSCVISLSTALYSILDTTFSFNHLFATSEVLRPSRARTSWI